MAKLQSKSQKKRQSRLLEAVGMESIEDQPRRVKTKSARHKANEAWQRSHAAPLVCQTPAQENYLQCIQDHTVTFGVGPAGTGKTHVSVKYACQQIDEGHYGGIVVLRPLVEMGKSLGALPGELKDKMAPWAEPFLKVFREHYGQSAMEAKFNGAHPSIEFIALQHVRGRTFDNRIVILDEAQNTTPLEMKTLLTRLGKDSKLILNGDVDQVDIHGRSGMVDALEILQNVGSIGVARFVEEDIVRSDIVRDILIAYRQHSRDKVGKK